MQHAFLHGVSEIRLPLNTVSVRLLFGSFFLFFSLIAIAQPANDEPANATALTLGAAAISATVNDATDSGQNLCDVGYNDEDDDIFYTFVAPTSGSIDVELVTVSGVGQDPMVSVLSGSVGALACEDFSFDLESSFSGLTSGVTYYLQVYSFDELTPDRTFTVAVSETPSAPSNDDCANATPLGIGVAGSGTLAASTSSGLDPCGGGLANDDVWYSFTATATESSVYVDRTGGVDDGLRVGVHTGSCGSLTSMACNLAGGESLHLTGLTIGGKYYVQVFSNLTMSSSNMTFDIEVVAPPSNDDCANATSLSCGASVTDSYRGSTPSASTGCVTRGVWYTVVGTGGGLTINASPTANNDVALEIYTGACGSLSQVVCEDSGIEGEDDSYSFLSLADQTYYIYVGESSFLDDNEGSFTLDVTCNTLLGVASASGCDNTVNNVTMTGSGEWLPIILGSTIVGKIKDSEALGITTISLYGNTGALRMSNSNPYADRNITINPASAPSTTIAVRLYFTLAEINALIAADASVSSISDLQFTKVSGVSCSGSFPGGGIQLSNTATGSYGADFYVETAVAAFSEFFLSSSSAPLPIELASFSAFAKTGQTQVDWQTASERNVDYFSIERSEDGVTFSEIGELPAVGESNILQSYTFFDNNPVEKAYYRLVSYDLDGTFAESDLVYVEQVLAEAVSISVYPNPTSDLLNVSGGVGATVQLIDPTGRIVEERSISDEVAQFQTVRFPKGIYFVRVVSGAEVSTKQVVLK